jgi:hypothetical protein
MTKLRRIYIKEPREEGANYSVEVKEAFTVKAEDYKEFMSALIAKIEPATETEDELRAQRDRAIEYIKDEIPCDEVDCKKIPCVECPYVFGEPAKTEDTPVSQSERVVALATISREDLLKIVDILQTQRDKAIEFFRDGCPGDCKLDDDCAKCPLIFGEKDPQA